MRAVLNKFGPESTLKALTTSATDRSKLTTSQLQSARCVPVPTYHLTILSLALVKIQALYREMKRVDHTKMVHRFSHIWLTMRLHAKRFHSVEGHQLTHVAALVVGKLRKLFLQAMLMRATTKHPNLKCYATTNGQKWICKVSINLIFLHPSYLLCLRK